MFVYVLTENEANEGGTVAGVYSTEQKAREAIAVSESPTASSSGTLLRIGVDDPSGDAVAVPLD